MKRWYTAVMVVLALAPAGGVHAAELVMFESERCSWCQRWHQEIGVIYGKTQEARLVPLRRVDLDEPVPADLAGIRGVHYTPTFVLLQEGVEVGRILGYPGQDFFWGLLAEELTKLKPESVDAGANSGVAGCKDNPSQENVHETTGNLAAVC